MSAPKLFGTDGMRGMQELARQVVAVRSSGFRSQPHAAFGTCHRVQRFRYSR